MNLKFYKGSTKPNIEGSLWFNTSNNRIELITKSGTTTFGSEISDVDYSFDTLTIYKINGSSIEVDLSSFLTTSDLSTELENKLNKIQINGVAFDNNSLNLKSGDGISLSGTVSTGDVTISTFPFTTTEINDGTINKSHLPTGLVTSVNGSTGDVTLTIPEAINIKTTYSSSTDSTASVGTGDIDIYYRENSDKINATKIGEFHVGDKTQAVYGPKCVASLGGQTGSIIVSTGLEMDGALIRVKTANGVSEGIVSGQTAVSTDGLTKCYIKNGVVYYKEGTSISKTSELTNDSGFITTSALTDYVTSSSLTTTLSSYAKMSDLPTVPTKTSDLTNDSNFITKSDLTTETWTFVTEDGTVTKKVYIG